MYILSVVVAGIGIAWLVLRPIMRINRTAQQGRGWLWLVIPTFGFFALGFLYSVVEFIRNKGPDDWGAIFHAMYVPQEKYGPLESPQITIGNYDFVKDPGDQFSGTYHFRYRCAGQNGAVLFHYDKATGKFDRDEIVPDK